MVRVVLDDFGPRHHRGPVRQVLDSDCDGDARHRPGAEPVPDTRTARLRQRTRVGYDDDGVPQFSWDEVWSGPVIEQDLREEFDAQAGMTSVRGTAVIGYGGAVAETSVLVTVDGMWRVTQSETHPHGVKLWISRIQQVPTGGGGS